MNPIILAASVLRLPIVGVALWLAWRSKWRWFYVGATLIALNAVPMLVVLATDLSSLEVANPYAWNSFAYRAGQWAAGSLKNLAFILALFIFDTKRVAFPGWATPALFGVYVTGAWSVWALSAYINYAQQEHLADSFSGLILIAQTAGLAAKTSLFLALALFPLAIWRFYKNYALRMDHTA